MSKDFGPGPALAWMAMDGKGDLHGPFAWLAGKGGFIFYAAEKALMGPWTLVEVVNGDPRPAPEVFIEAASRRPAS